ncbi:MAG: hypothetical protein HQK51_03685 [Oligoflexia bacterium]|nr:hypothetical protein [Oligoflexia bacterium]
MVQNNDYETQYDPSKGFIGNYQVQVSNYIFKTNIETNIERIEAHPYAAKFASKILSTLPSEHYKRSEELTRFVKKRGLTFSKITKSGKYKLFTVPVTSTVTPISKSNFDYLEKAAQVFIFSLRKVLQSIYGEKDVCDSYFIKQLPKDTQEIFIKSILSSPQYIKQLHHPVMKDYPFFDTVGLDFVLVDDFIKLKNQHIPPSFPFNLLEINAGSPSGASNNSQILEGMWQSSRDFLESFDRVMPNDHYKILGDTYRSLGEYWTKRKDGVSIVLPPGGANGAAPEIHQLATYSGLYYVDANQLYSDDEGNLRIKTVSQNDPIVSSVYSRVNIDSKLFDPKKGIFMRDQETGKTVYTEDSVLSNGKKQLLKDSMGNTIPAVSHHAIPNAIDAIHSKKIYIGGLNRILDNKILLPILSYYAPRIYRNELLTLGLNPDLFCIKPPETLPSIRKSVEEVKLCPSNWVVKSPELSGGKGIYIMQTLEKKEKEEVLKKAFSSPESFTYQRLVRIGRIPVAVREAKNSYRFANLAADLRMWVFFGAGEGNERPKLTHNALVRIAPKEKGPQSSTVNTSQGGGYSAMIVVDDVDSNESVSIRELVKEKAPIPINIDVPIFVASQIVHLKYLVEKLKSLLKIAIEKKGSVQDIFEMYKIVKAVEGQTREIHSYLDPKNMEPLTEILDLFESKNIEAKISKYNSKLNQYKILLTEKIAEVENNLSDDFFKVLDKITERDFHSKNDLFKQLVKDDIELLDQLPTRPNLCRLFKDSDYKKIEELIDQFFMLMKMRFITHKSENYLKILQTNKYDDFFTYNILFDKKDDNKKENVETITIASKLENSIGKSLVESDIKGDFLSEEIIKARSNWLSILQEASSSGRYREQLLQLRRDEHFKKFPFLVKYQNILNKGGGGASGGNVSVSELETLLDVLPYAKYNLQKFSNTVLAGSLNSLLSRELTPNKIAILDLEQRKKAGVYDYYIDGETFLSKRASEDYLHKGKLIIWVSEELSPLIKLYTIGHEIIHYQQLREIMLMEEQTLKEDPVAFSYFLSFYANYLGFSTNQMAEENNSFNKIGRREIYGLDALKQYKRKSKLIKELIETLKKKSCSYNDMLLKYGSLLGLMTATPNPLKVKAIREVIPAIENAKNILFAKELGLNLNNIDEVRACLPIANEEQLKRHSKDIMNMIKSPKLDYEVLRIIANHQVYGVYFERIEEIKDIFNLQVESVPIFAGTCYNNIQQ